MHFSFVPGLELISPLSLFYVTEAFVKHQCFRWDLLSLSLGAAATVCNYLCHGLLFSGTA